MERRTKARQKSCFYARALAARAFIVIIRCKFLLRGGSLYHSRVMIWSRGNCAFEGFRVTSCGRSSPFCVILLVEILDIPHEVFSKLRHKYLGVVYWKFESPNKWCDKNKHWIFGKRLSWADPQNIELAGRKCAMKILSNADVPATKSKIPACWVNFRRISIQESFGNEDLGVISIVLSKSNGPDKTVSDLG